MLQNLQILPNFKKNQLENLVDFEKCCKTRIFLQKSEPIQPKTSNSLPKFCQPTLSNLPASWRQRGFRRPRPTGQSLRSPRPGCTVHRPTGAGRGQALDAAEPMLAKLDKLLPKQFNFTKFWRARSRLYRSRFL